MVSRTATRDRSVDLASPTAFTAHLPNPSSRGCLHPTSIRETTSSAAMALEITRGATTDLDKARALFEWIVVNTYRNPKTHGCGRGDIRFMLESGDLGGKCADLNALFVGLAHCRSARAGCLRNARCPFQSGLQKPGRIVPGHHQIQHCRAEVYVREYGWIPIDPADVRKVIREEPPGNLPLTDEKVAAARTRLFGSGEMNWIAYNFATDVNLPGARFGRLPYFMYPQAETAEGRLDCLDPNAFRYSITRSGLLRLMS